MASKKVRSWKQGKIVVQYMDDDGRQKQWPDEYASIEAARDAIRTKGGVGDGYQIAMILDDISLVASVDLVSTTDAAPKPRKRAPRVKKPAEVKEAKEETAPMFPTPPAATSDEKWPKPTARELPQPTL